MRMGWTAPFGDEGGGVDHLGMRVAGEVAYGELLDFTTTVSWRPRYFSFYCWLLRRAFLAAGGDESQTEHELDLAVWTDVVKRGDYAYAAASLLADPEAGRVAGKLKIAKRLDEPFIEFKKDHLRSSRGGFDIYAGPMRQIGLVERAALGGGRLFERPFGRGRQLADAFEGSLRETGHPDVLSGDTADRSALLEVGEICGLTWLSAATDTAASVEKERALLRECIVDFARVGSSDLVRRRVLTIGLILRLFSLLEPGRPSLEDFREFTLLGAYRKGGRRKRHSPAKAYESILGSWAVYQGHAYATYALENLLEGALEIAEELCHESPGGIPLDRVLTDFKEYLVEGEPEQPLGLAEDWYSKPLRQTLAGLRKVVAAGATADFCEPDLFSAIRDSQSREQWMHDASLLLLLSMERLRFQLARYGPEAWTGARDPARLPPATLVETLDAYDGDESTSEVLAELVLNLALRQHRRTAFRKLAAQSKPDSALFQLHGRRVVDVLRFQPGTSNPRFENAVMFLEDLGYLRASAPGLTDDGEKLLATIEPMDS